VRSAVACAALYAFVTLRSDLLSYSLTDPDRDIGAAAPWRRVCSRCDACCRTVARVVGAGQVAAAAAVPPLLSESEAVLLPRALAHRVHHLRS
jgi:hypothetical protein